MYTESRLKKRKRKKKKSGACAIKKKEREKELKKYMIWFQKGIENWAENKWNNSNHKHRASNFMDLSKI